MKFRDGMVGLSTFPMLCGGIWKPALGHERIVEKSYCKIGGNGNIILKYKYTWEYHYKRIDIP